jgi:hypothetical protein
MNGRTNVHGEEQSDRPFIVSADLIQCVDQNIFERWCFTISEPPYEFPQISPTVLHEIITVRLGHRKCDARWVQKMLKTQRMASALTFLVRYHKDANEFLSHVV